MKKTTTFAQRLKEYMDLHNDLTYERLAEITGVPAQTLNRYVLNQRVPKINDFEKIAIALNANPLWLQGFDEPMAFPSAEKTDSIIATYSDEEREHILKYRQLNKVGKVKIDEQMDDMLKLNKYTDEPEIPSQKYA